MKDETFERRKKVIFDFICDKNYVPMKIKEMAVLLQVTKEERPQLQEVLEELLTEGKIEVNKRGKYKKAEESDLTGTFIAHQKGFGFVEIEGREEDIYIPESETGGAFHQDTVQVKILPSKEGKRREGRVIKVLARGITEVVGTYQKSKNFGFVVPDSLRFTKDRCV